MSFTGALIVLDAHLVSAGAAVTPPIGNVAQGGRANLQQRIDYYVTTIAAPERFGGAHETFTDWMFGVGLDVRLYIPVADRSETLAANIDARLYAVTVDITTRLMGDYTLGANCTAMTIDGAEFGWLENSGAWLRVATIPIVLDFVEQVTIAP